MIVKTETFHDDDAANGDEMGLDSGFGAKLLLHFSNPLITKGIPASSLAMRRMKKAKSKVVSEFGRKCDLEAIQAKGRDSYSQGAGNSLINTNTNGRWCHSVILTNFVSLLIFWVFSITLPINSSKHFH